MLMGPSAPLLIISIALQAARAEFQFPTFPIGPHITALGRAGVALPSDAAADLNPASMLGAARLSLQRFEGYSGYAGTLLAGVITIHTRGALGVSARRFSWGNVIQDDLGPGTADLNADQTQVAVTAAISLGAHVVVGARVSQIEADNLGVITSGVTYSTGAIVRYASHGSLGFAIRDAGAPVNPPNGDISFPLPTRVRVGLFEAFHLRGQSFTIVADAESRRLGVQSPRLAGGIEWIVTPMLALRAGYETIPSPDVPNRREGHVSGGIGVRLHPFDLGLAVRSAGSSQGYELLLGLDAFRP
jgi:hypothetical protein